MALSLLAAGACQFDPGGGAAPGDGGTFADTGVPVIDAGPVPDAPPGTPDADVVCTPNATACEGRTLHTCNSTGDDYVSSVECAFTCEDNARCTVASNVPQDDQLACDVGVPLTPAGNVVLEADRITCDGTCGDGPMIEGQVVGGVTWYCLSEVNIAGTRTITAAAGLDRAVLFFVDQRATIAGTIRLDGGDALVGGTGATPGAGGPGGGDGGGLQLGEPERGDGSCGGPPGQTRGGGGNRVGGGGAGGGHGGAGGNGGDGLTSSGGGEFAPGGNSVGVCGMATLEPLVGGSGGGAGGDGSCGSCSWPGGGGGGAIQISARGGVVVSGAIIATGGDGISRIDGENGRGGGGGGGAGGAILLEGPTVDATNLVVDGGRGGSAAAGPGGIGATGGQINGAVGATADANNEGGSGGGGAGGRIRLNASATPSCTGVSSPSASCTTGSLQASP